MHPIIQSPQDRQLIIGSGVRVQSAGTAGGGGVESQYAVGFDGTNDYVVTNAAVRSPGAGDLSFCGWFYLGSVSALQALFSQLDGTGTGQSWLEVTAAAKLQSQLGGAATTGTRTLVAGAWNHFAVTVSGTTLTLYVNGIADTSATRTMQAATGVANIGASKAPGDYFNGRADDLRIYSRALSAAEVQSIYRNTSSPPTDGLVAYFPMDEGTGTSTTDTIGGLVGTLTNGPTWQPQVCPRLRSDREIATNGWGLQFDGVNDYVSIPAGETGGERLITVVLWMKSDANSSNLYARLVDHGFYTDPANNWTIGVNNDSLSNKLMVHTYNGVPRFSGNRVVCDGTWHHVAVTFDMVSGSASIFIDGTLDITSGITAITPTAQALDIGSHAGVSEKYTGLLKDIRIYNSILSDSDIAELANNQAIAATPVGHWKLDDGTGITATDSSGNGNHGTLTNGPTWIADIPQWYRSTIESSYALGTMDASDDYVSIATPPITAAPATLMCWFQSSSVAANQVLVSVGQVANETEYFALRAAGAVASDPIQAVASQTTEAAAASATGYAANTWYHAAAVFASATSRIAYINGVAGTAETTNKAPASLTAADIGRLKKQTPAEYVAGSVDEVCIHNIALPAAAIADAAAGYLVSAGLVSRYKLDGNANDAVGSNNGTEQGGVTYSSAVSGTL